jgi:Uma2 family endonuclease
MTHLEETTEFLLDQFKCIPGKSEIVNGKIITMPPTGEEPGLTSGEVFVSLHDHAKITRTGRAVPDNVGFRVNLPNRHYFSPDAAYILQQRSGSAGFINGAPVFAVEVRSENDFGPAMETEITQKRADYFAAGTLVVWDVNPFGEDEIVFKYSSSDPQNPQIFRRGEVADAEPAVVGWRMRVDDLFA